MFLIVGFFSTHAEEKIKRITITGISPGTEGDYTGGSLRETADGPDVVFCFAGYIMDGRLSMPLLVGNDNDGPGPWDGTGDYFVTFGEYITKNKVPVGAQDETIIDFSEFIHMGD
jgi:hypothetical protein